VSCRTSSCSFSSVDSERKGHAVRHSHEHFADENFPTHIYLADMPPSTREVFRVVGTDNTSCL
jgi:hypothetical protein